ncbi:hypothetical protein WDW37_07730 [Bdellovibrionota bacterium FG-1]
MLRVSAQITIIAWALLSYATHDAQANLESRLPEQSSIGLDSVGYFHVSQEASEGFRNQMAPQLVGKLNSHYLGPVVEAGAQTDLMLMFTRATDGSLKPSPYLELPELYFGTSKELFPLNLQLGRKLEHFSHLDEEWQLGLWQPRFRWDYLHPETVGLTGAFLNLDTPYFRVVVSGSPFFIPERGVPIETKQGVFASNSRWFIPPPATIPIFGQDTPVRYSLVMPELGDLVAHPGASIMARVGAESGPWGLVGYAYKPVNQLLLAADGVLQLSDRQPIYVDAQIYPRVVYHHLTSAEAGYSGERMNTWFSVLGERPEMDTTPAQWTTQQIVPSLAMSAAFDLRIMGSIESPTSIGLSYLRQWGGNAGDEGPEATGGSASSFEARYPYQSAVSLGLKSRLFSSFSGSSRVLYDFGHEGTVWSTELRYRPHQNWMLGAGADLLAAPSGEDLDGSDLLSRYRANDRVHAGVTYVF